mgnify:CR=1 FL=1
MKKYNIIAGVDEVGRGGLAGPVVSAAVILKEGVKLKNIKDSKNLNFKQRLEVSKVINDLPAISVERLSSNLLIHASNVCLTKLIPALSMFEYVWLSPFELIK